MSDIYARIEGRLEALDLPYARASRAAGLNQAYLRQLLKDKTSPTVQIIEKLAPVLETSVAWLVAGEGPEHIIPEDAAFVELAGLWRALPPDKQSHLLSYARFLASDTTGDK